MCLISIIIPVFNVEAYLTRCIESVLIQTYKNIEIIIIDDGSCDSCTQICDEYSIKDSRIKVLHQKNLGLSSARNSGLDVAIGDYVSFVDSDDWIHNRFLEVLTNQISKSENIDIVICNYFKTSKMSLVDKIIQRIDVTILNNHEACKQQTPLMTVSWNKIYKKHLFDLIRFPEGRLHEDEFITYKLLYFSKQICVINAQLYYYYQRDGSIMNTPSMKGWVDTTKALSEKVLFFKKQKQKETAQITAYHYEWFIKHKIQKDTANKKLYYKDYRNLIVLTKGVFSLDQRIFMYLKYLRKRI